MDHHHGRREDRSDQADSSIWGVVMVDGGDESSGRAFTVEFQVWERGRCAEERSACAGDSDEVWG